MESQLNLIHAKGYTLVSLLRELKLSRSDYRKESGKQLVAALLQKKIKLYCTACNIALFASRKRGICVKCCFKNYDKRRSSEKIRKQRIRTVETKAVRRKLRLLLKEKSIKLKFFIADNAIKNYNGQTVGFYDKIITELEKAARAT